MRIFDQLLKLVNPFLKDRGFFSQAQNIQIGEPYESDFPRFNIKIVSLVPYFLFESMIFLGRTSMIAFVFMAASYFVTGQIIPGVA